MKINKNDLPITMQTPDTIMRAQADLGGMTVCFNEVPAGTDFSPLLKGLKNDSCHCPHWGYLFEGKMLVKYVDGKEEILETGDIFYLPPGHTGKILEDTKVIEFNPTKAFNEVGVHAEKVMAAMAASATIADLAIRTRGNSNGTPIIFIHGGMGDECAAIVNEPALTDNFYIIDYHRRGWGKSKPSAQPMSIAQQVLDCKAILDHLKIPKTHIVGQSYGGVIALQMALDFPEMVQSLALLEPGLPSILNNAPQYLESVGKAMQAYEVGETKRAIELFAAEIFGNNYRPFFDENLPKGYMDRYVADADNLIQMDAPALATWQFGKADAARIKQPILNMTGANSNPYFTEIFKTVEKWFPQAENFVLPNASHVMLQMNPKGAAERLARFFKNN